MHAMGWLRRGGVVVVTSDLGFVVVVDLPTRHGKPLVPLLDVPTEVHQYLAAFAVSARTINAARQPLPSNVKCVDVCSHR